MDSILKNILSNALKYTPRGGSIQVRAFVDRHVWGVEVEDTGIGIPPEERKKLFRNHSGAVMPSICKWRETVSD